ncbi:VOC family protein [Rhizobium leguminosarum]|uniref:VOC family protein n=1 Tax=Rhizobium leguminosarum TaxID=384 RepID=A0AAJ1EBM3_RHILE|nr:VOC family protein [Rhizobium leguminosarum]MBY5532110.1 VOC family protein [Rhizobium leguminosarum]MBY5560098.1 VOC family protein [Rhizobium leguminosarum]MBY5593414.1 VOC family protein [Rhizobium leguminosarum]MBY5613451.1 VOC family protein [Rhizobium leguminosarum]MBY5627383.1 VOC family protein [Rhizobium leguminosarum]
MSVYATVGAIDSVKSNEFYDATLATIGWSKHREFPGWSAYSERGKGEGFVLWVCKPFNGEPASAGNGSMVAFMAKSRAEVDAFYDVAMTNGGTDEGAPGLRPHYGPNWYSAYVRDPAGNKIAVVYDS